MLVSHNVIYLKCQTCHEKLYLHEKKSDHNGEICNKCYDMLYPEMDEDTIEELEGFLRIEPEAYKKEPKGIK